MQPAAAYQSAPHGRRAVASFAGFLRYPAENAYLEGWQDNVFVSPDAVRFMTVPHATGLEWLRQIATFGEAGGAVRIAQRTS